MSVFIINFMPNMELVVLYIDLCFKTRHIIPGIKNTLWYEKLTFDQENVKVFYIVQTLGQSSVLLLVYILADSPHLLTLLSLFGQTALSTWGAWLRVGFPNSF